MSQSPNSKTWTRLLLGTAVGGFLLAAQSAAAAPPNAAAPVAENAPEAKS